MMVEEEKCIKSIFNLTMLAKIAIRPTVFYDIECWSLKKQHIHKMCVIRMRMIYWIVENKQKTLFKI